MGRRERKLLVVSPIKHRVDYMRGISGQRKVPIMRCLFKYLSRDVEISQGPSCGYNILSWLDGRFGALKLSFIHVLRRVVIDARARV